MSQPSSDGGLGPTVTSFPFLPAILALVVYLAVSKVDRTEETKAHELQDA